MNLILCEGFSVTAIAAGLDRGNCQRRDIGPAGRQKNRVKFWIYETQFQGRPHNHISSCTRIASATSGGYLHNESLLAKLVTWTVESLFRLFVNSAHPRVCEMS